MRIAIIGTGISGLVAAYKLCNDHSISVFEANGYAGGHTNTVNVDLNDEQQVIDTGFIVFNDRTYPNFCALLNELHVASEPTLMSFSVRSDADNLEYNGSSVSALFAQKRNLIRPGFYRMIRDILRFNRESPSLLDKQDHAMTVGQYLQQEDYSSDFARNYLLPMGAAIWSCPTTTFEDFPIHFIVEFYLNHGLLSLRDRPTWRVVKGGSRQYVEALTRNFSDRIQLNTPVQSVLRTNDGVSVMTEGGTEFFDEVVFACHSDQALKILGNEATPTETTLLEAIPYEPNSAILHTDTSVLPRRKKTWASWNYHIPSGQSDHATLTYNMNILQHINSQHTFCVSLNDTGLIDPDKVIRTFRYSHPVFTVARKAAQQRHDELIRHNRTSFCGAYWGNGFHEDGVNSALKVTNAFCTEPLLTRSEAINA